MANVLIVEDVFIIAELLQNALEADGYTVSGIARTVAEAMAIAGRVALDFAVINLNLARGENGAEVGRRLRRERSVGIMFSTGKDRDHGLTTRDGDAVMLKPYRMSDIGRGLAIVGELTRCGRTTSAFPPGFALLGPALTAP